MNLQPSQTRQITVVYHRADYDGLFSREVAYHFLGEQATYIGWDHGDPKLQFPATGMVYVIDLSPDCFEVLRATDIPRLIWIDHHKSSIEKWTPERCGGIIPGYRIDGVAACRLAYQWFLCADGNAPRRGAEIGMPIRPAGVLPMIQDFKKRDVSEPYAVTLAGEYDIFDHGPSKGASETFQFGLDAIHHIDWKTLLQPGLDGKYEVDEILRVGEYAQQCYRNRDAKVIRDRSFVATFEGVPFLCLNTARCNSQTFAALDVPETKHDALLAFYWTGKCWTVSLYHSVHRKDIDLSPIAVKWGREINPEDGKPFGGGGHPGACGFRASWLPFLPHS